MLILQIGFWSFIAWVVFRWERFSDALRSWGSRGLLLAALFSFGVSPFLTGEYSRSVILFIGGPNPHHVETIQGSYTWLTFGIGVAFLALHAVSRWGNRLPWHGPAGRAMKLSLVILLLRIYFEKLGVPEDVAMFIGIIWLVVPLAVVFGREGAIAGSQFRFWVWVSSYAFGIRAIIVALMFLVTYFHLGTHFDNSSVTEYTLFGTVYNVEAGSWEQYVNLIVMPQLILWPGVTLLAGLVFGMPTYFIVKRSL